MGPVSFDTGKTRQNAELRRMSTFNGAIRPNRTPDAQLCQIAPHVHNCETFLVTHPSKLSEACEDSGEETRMTNLAHQLLDLEPQIRRKDRRGDGADLFQDVALKCIEHENRTKIDWTLESAPSLILRIATNCEINRYRRERLRRCQSLQYAPPSVLAASQPAAMLELTETLSVDDRQLVLDHLVGGKSLTEIADERSRSAGGLRGRWHRIRTKLRQEEDAA